MVNPSSPPSPLDTDIEDVEQGSKRMIQTNFFLQIGEHFWVQIPCELFGGKQQRIFGNE